ncbi:alpha-galactosidase [Mangrovibacterium diazotrophicum]|uniref:Alpha-galactosidase n=1 Tax=Mangrovibacterium diazotrophicum TaxID=1261403 RepID=A0A419VYJ9_9BACT|nr:alpha-galactosidase [Mangrovibacterium diazotrophicum]RKD88298.1 alpha-galactosidase [Mangrovibacterium diazotrophicum]
MKKIVVLILALVLGANLYAQKFEGLALTPPMGWNSWNYFRDKINEDVIKQIADAMVATGLSDAGYEYINLDDCWQIGRDEKGYIVVDSINFPSGMKALADYVHSRGLKFGLYSCAGEMTCMKRPGGRGYEFQDAWTYAQWGVDYLKYDFCFHGTQDSRASYKTMRDALYRAGRPIVFSICEWGSTEPWLWAGEMGHLYRTTIDIMDCADCRLSTGARGWMNILEEQVPIWTYNGPGHWNDPDMLEVGNGGLSMLENKSHFTMWCMLSAPLILGNDLRAMETDILKILENEDLIAIDQDPMGKSAFRYIKDEDIDIWCKQLTGNRWAVAILNRSEYERPYKCEWNIRAMTRYFEDWENKGDYKIWNVWDKKKMGTTADDLEGTLSGRDVLLLVLESN